MDDQAYLERLHKELSDKGLLVAAGFVAYRLTAMPQGVSATQLEETKKAFMAGAAHVFFSCMMVLEEGDEVTETDLNRMTKVANELQHFAELYTLQYGKTEGKA